MGYFKPGIKKALKVHTQNAVTLLFGALMHLSYVSRWGAITLHVASSMSQHSQRMLSRRS